MLEEEINKLPKLATGHVLIHLPTGHLMEAGKFRINKLLDL